MQEIVQNVLCFCFQQKIFMKLDDASFSFSYIFTKQGLRIP